MNISSANSQSETMQFTLKPSQRSVKGLSDINPLSQHLWEHIRSVSSEFAHSYGYNRIDLPLLEQVSLYTRTVGKNSDLVKNELVTLSSKEGEEYALRPEARISLSRAYIEHGLYDAPQPVRMYNEGMFIKNDFTQKERFKQTYQGHFAAFGSIDPMIDAQLIYIAYKSLASLGLDSLMVYINTVATIEVRNQYKKALIEYFRTQRSELTEDSRKIITKQPFDILTSTDIALQPIIEQAPQIVDFLDIESQQHFMKVLEYLDELDVPYFLKHSLISDKDYETHTIFSIISETDEATSQIALAHGGRFDKMLDSFINSTIPAVSATLLFDRIINALQTTQVDVPRVNVCDLFVAQLGEEAKKKSLQLFEKLRSEGLSVSEDLAQDGLKQQLASAAKCGVKYALILGQKEIMDDTIMVRDMENGIQEIIDFKKIVPEIKKRLSKDLVVKKTRKAATKVGK